MTDEEKKAFLAGWEAYRSQALDAISRAIPRTRAGETYQRLVMTQVNVLEPPVALAKVAAKDGTREKFEALKARHTREPGEDDEERERYP